MKSGLHFRHQIHYRPELEAIHLVDVRVNYMHTLTLNLCAKHGGARIAAMT